MVNYQLELDKILTALPADGTPPRLLLHACCAPCSSYVLEYLSRYFAITLDYYNPNIYPEAEYRRRAAECAAFVAQQPHVYPVTYKEAPYRPEEFYAAAKGLEAVPEGGERCFACYALRLEQAARQAAAEGYAWFCTTLSISPHKNAQKLNELGLALGQKYGVRYLPSDFKKKGGYLRSTQLAKEYGLYRQDYCGCVYSMRTDSPAQ